METTLTPADVDRALAPVRIAAASFETRFPGDREGRQPVHTLYGGAHLFRAGSARKLGDLARRALDTNAPDGATLAEAMALEVAPALADSIRARVVEKLSVEPVEDMRIDFEDGYGVRADEEEDRHAASAAAEVAAGFAASTLPPFVGIRIKALGPELFARGARTLDLFVTALVEKTRGALPAGFVVTLPKVQVPEHVAALADLLDTLEAKLGLARGALPIEIMIEQPQAIFDAGGAVAPPALVAAARGRCIGAHFGTYDYTASLGVTAAHQRLAHPACDFAKHVLQVSLAGSGVWLSDGATTVMPLGDRAAVHAAWRLHASNVRHALASGFYQGWDLHPAQLVARYTAVYAFFLGALPAATERLASFVAHAARATLVGGVFDDAATGQGLLNFFLRGLACGAIMEEEVLATGLTVAELRMRSFARILAGRAPR